MECQHFHGPGVQRVSWPSAGFLYQDQRHSRLEHDVHRYHGRGWNDVLLRSYGSQFQRAREHLLRASGNHNSVRERLCRLSAGGVAPRASMVPRSRSWEGCSSSPICTMGSGSLLSTRCGQRPRIRCWDRISSRPPLERAAVTAAKIRHRPKRPERHRSMKRISSIRVFSVGAD